METRAPRNRHPGVEPQARNATRLIPAASFRDAGLSAWAAGAAAASAATVASHVRANEERFIARQCSIEARRVVVSVSEYGVQSARRCGIPTRVADVGRLELKILIVGCALAAAMSLTGVAHGAGPVYRVTKLPSLGGSSFGSGINDRGWVTGGSHRPGDGTLHATLWTHGALRELGTLGGPNSAVIWPVKNVRGIVAGIAQTAEPDPYGEPWSCSAFFPEATGTGRRCVGFKWKDGVMTALPTLGGTHGFATGANNRGQIAGWAESTVRDPTCVEGQIFQFRAVVWGPRDDQIRELPPYPGDTVSAATALNDRGQVVGISGICDRAVGRFSARHAVLWDHGEVEDLGSIGGVAWRTPMSINHRGDIVGFANARAEDAGAFKPQAFRWTQRGGIRKLGAGVLPGDVTSQALGINARREVVGTSCDERGSCRAFLWRNGALMDLNRLAFPRGDRLITAGDIDDRGRITGQARDAITGRLVAFVATPVR